MFLFLCTEERDHASMQWDTTILRQERVLLSIWPCTLISDFQSSELWENKNYLLFNPPVYGILFCQLQLPILQQPECLFFFILNLRSLLPPQFGFPSEPLSLNACSYLWLLVLSSFLASGGFLFSLSSKICLIKYFLIVLYFAKLFCVIQVFFSNMNFNTLTENLVFPS